MFNNPEKRFELIIILFISGLILSLIAEYVLHLNIIIFVLIIVFSLGLLLCEIFTEQRMVNQLNLGNYAKALQYAKRLKLLFPGSIQPFIEILSLLNKISAGETDQEAAQDLLKNFFESKSEETASMALFQYGLLYDFESLLPWFEAKFPEYNCRKPK